MFRLILRYMHWVRSASHRTQIIFQGRSKSSTDRSLCWGYFDGAFHSSQNFSSAGGILYFSNYHYIKFKAGLGAGSNNSPELMALKLLMKCALDKNISRIHIFGYPALVIKWMAGTSQLHNGWLRPPGESL
jgi:hypothetical protein